MLNIVRLMLPVDIRRWGVWEEERVETVSVLCISDKFTRGWVKWEEEEGFSLTVGLLQ